MSKSFLVVQGLPERPSGFAPILGGLLFLLCLAALGTALFLFGDLARITGARTRVLSLLGVGATTFVVLGVLFFVALVLERKRHLGPTGRAEFRELGVFITKRDATIGVPWTDLAGYRDHSTEFVELVTRSRRYESWMVTVPTPTEKERVAVLAALDARGIGRVEG